MTALSYLQPGLVLQREASGQAVWDLQHDLRRLGYLKVGIDGQFGPGTQLAVMALQYDLLNNAGGGTDGDAPVRVIDYNKGRVSGITGQVDQGMASCIFDIVNDAAFPKLPFATNPRAENQRVAAQIAALSNQAAPIPFLLAILRQEGGLKHYYEPPAADDDTFIVVGLDHNLTGSAQPYAITSRGYGAGQYTLFHHPPTAQEVEQVMLDPANNVRMAISALRDKFDHFVMSANPATSADDRMAEFGDGSLRLCKYDQTDARYMNDCRACAVNAGLQPIVPGVTAFYSGADGIYQTTQYYNPAPVKTVPMRANFGCDWPYAARRYNGSGVNSYWYQSLILNHLLQQ